MGDTKLCETCSLWGTVDVGEVVRSGHHANCPNHPAKVLDERNLLRERQANITALLGVLPEHPRFASDFDAIEWLIEEPSRLRAALEPFAEYASQVDASYPEGLPPAERLECAWTVKYESLSLCDCYRAREALGPKPEAKMPDIPLNLSAEEAKFLWRSLSDIAGLAKDEEHKHCMRLLEKLAEVVPEGDR